MLDQEDEKHGRVLIIAGSDPSGGAGIQADLKTVTSLGGYAATAITALTVQNTLGVTGVLPIDPDFIKAQMLAVVEDIGVDAVKTGMLHSKEVIKMVAKTLQKAAFEGPIVVDPVMVATSGDRLLQEDALDALKKYLIPMAAVITPNIPEAELLTGLKIRSLEEMRVAADDILSLGADAVVIKGGHLKGEILTDLLVTDDGSETICTTPRRQTRHTHGTGCTFASAIATKLARGEELEDAFKAAHAYVKAAIRAAPGFGSGHGPLGHASVRMS